MGDLVGILNGKPVTKPLHIALARLKTGRDPRHRKVVGIAHAGLGQACAPTDDNGRNENQLISHDGITLGCEGRITGLRPLDEHFRHLDVKIAIDDQNPAPGGEGLVRLIAALVRHGLGPTDAVRKGAVAC